MEYEAVIGFEVHVQLATRAKVFCSCRNEVGGPPNSRVCPVCLGMPGALPVLNEKVIDSGMRVALALGATVGERSGFARKNYFYPDLPKGYQITQDVEPLARGGHVDVQVGSDVRRVRIRQIHIEEDAGKSVHVTRDGGRVSLIDANRCGVPLLEIVTLPDVRSPEEADALLTRLRETVVFLGVATGNMHEGSLRFDTNVSVRSKGDETLGTQTEIKNLNSFRAVRKALRFEIERQASLLSRGDAVVHETLLWDEDTGRAEPMRSKEAPSDYRYFPEPDLVDVVIDEERMQALRETMPELPDAVRDRLRQAYGLPEYAAAVLAADPDTVLYFEAAVSELARRVRPDLDIPAVEGAFSDAAPGGRRELVALSASVPMDELRAVSKIVSNWVMTVVGALLNAEGIGVATFARTRMAPGRLAEILLPRLEGDISEPAAKRLFDAALTRPDPVGDLIHTMDLRQLSDEETLAAIVRGVLKASPREVERYRDGEHKLLEHFMGQVMKKTRGRANPRLAEDILRRELER